jgi:hypothetical protein
MPRRQPFTQQNVDDRRNILSEASSGDFGDVLDYLGISHIPTRERCIKELGLIAGLYWVTLRGEQQETPASKAEAFKKAPRQHPKRQRAFELRAKARKLLDQGNQQEAKRITAVASRIFRQPWLAPSLEYEAARLQSQGLDPYQSYVELENKYRRQSRGGRCESFALMQTIHRLQDFASNLDDKLTWRIRRIPPKLIPFLIAFLEKAGIDHPNFVTNPSKFRKLMLKPLLSSSQSQNRGRLRRCSKRGY